MVVVLEREAADWAAEVAMEVGGWAGAGCRLGSGE